MKKYVTVLIIILFMAISGCSSAEPADVAERKAGPAAGSEKAQKEPEKKEKPKVTSVRLAAIGDILLHSPVMDDAAKRNGSYDFSPMFKEVKPFIEGADIAVANQETMIGGKELGLSGYPSFNSPYEIGDALKDTGIDLVTIANNHTLDRGEKAIRNAVKYWNQIDMPYTGAHISQKDRDEIRTITKNDITISFLSYTYGTNGIPVPKGKSWLVNLIDPDLIEADIKRAREISDVVSVSMHWGNEYEKMPNQTQIDLAESLSEMGADLIIGHHPHVLQPIDWIEREDGTRTLVIYSLGNFLSGQEGLDKMIGGIAGINVTKTSLEGRSSIELSEPSFIPTYSYYSSSKKDFAVIPMFGLNEQLLPKYKAHYRKTKEHIQVFSEDILIKEE